MTLQLRPTFSESWYRVVSLRPRLRATAQISRQYYRGDRWYVVRDPAGNQFHRLSDAAYRFVGLLDGSRTIGEAWELVGGQLADDAPTQPEVIQILSQLYAANLIETDVTPDAQVLLKRYKKQQSQKTKQRWMNMLFPRKSLWDPDRFIKTWMPVIRGMLSWPGALLWVVVVGGAVVSMLPEWDRLSRAASNAIDPGNWLLLMLTFVIIKFIHEMGHAFSCRRFGGEVHEVGVMLLVLMPTPYVDASSAWAFVNKWKRVFVGAGGMIFELFVAALCAFIWKFTSDATLLNQLAYNAMLIASFSTIVFNANPLLRYDGYYILSDLLEIPNLQNKSREYSMGLVKRHVFRVKSQQPLPPVGQRFWLFFYNIASSCYRIFVSLAIAYMLFYQLPEQVKVIGLVMGVAAMATFALMPIFKLFKYLATDPELHRKRVRASAFCLTIATAAVLLVGVIRWPVYVRAEGVLEAADRKTIFVGQPGFVTQVDVRDGQVVAEGDVLIRLRDPELYTQRAQYQAEIRRSEAKLQASMATGDPSFHADQLEVALNKDRLKDVEERIGRLTVTAPRAGRIVAPEIQNLQGQYLTRSFQLAQITDDSALEAFVIIDMRDQTKLKRDDHVKTEVRVTGDVTRTLVALDKPRLGVASIKEARSSVVTHVGAGSYQPDPTDPSGKKLKQEQFEARILLNNPDGQLQPGQRAYVRMTLSDSQPLAKQAFDWFLQLTMNAGA